MSLPTPTHDTSTAQAARAAWPGYGWCLRCGMPWSQVQHHSTPYGHTTPDGGEIVGGQGASVAGRSCFPLCVTCWDTLGHPEARIGYYGALLDGWEAAGVPVGASVRAAIGRAVANGF